MLEKKTGAAEAGGPEREAAANGLIVSIYEPSCTLQSMLYPLKLCLLFVTDSLMTLKYGGGDMVTVESF